MPVVRNHLYSQKEYQGKPISAPDPYCPCRPCWHLYHFPWWDKSGKRHDNWDCATRANHGCPDPMPEPIHVFYESKKFKKRRPGEKFTCLRCGAFIEPDKVKFVTVPEKNKEKVRKFLCQPLHR